MLGDGCQSGWGPGLLLPVFFVVFSSFFFVYLFDVLFFPWFLFLLESVVLDRWVSKYFSCLALFFSCFLSFFFFFFFFIPNELFVFSFCFFSHVRDCMSSVCG